MATPPRGAGVPVVATENETAKEVVKENYNELFYPTEKEWREKTVEDFKVAAEGVLNAKLK